MKKTKILILGASGMLGSAMLRFFASSSGVEVKGSVRSVAALKQLPDALRENIVCGIDVENQDSITALLSQTKPDVVINCVGLIKQLAQVDDPLSALPINSILPHRLARLCELISARLIHVSTDCVFSGNRGLYIEDDFPDAKDLYGRSKYLGEVAYPHAITLRTSIIGPELCGANGLVGWFLSQKDCVRGFRRAIFSGVPTVELARIVRDFVLPHRQLYGVYHVSAEPIDKFSLLSLVAKVYGKDISIEPDDSLVIDRSLNSDRFRQLTGYTPPTWPELIKMMHEFD